MAWLRSYHAPSALGGEARLGQDRGSHVPTASVVSRDADSHGGGEVLCEAHCDRPCGLKGRRKGRTGQELGSRESFLKVFSLELDLDI